MPAEFSKMATQLEVWKLQLKQRSSPLETQLQTASDLLLVQTPGLIVQFFLTVFIGQFLQPPL